MLVLETILELFDLLDIDEREFIIDCIIFPEIAGLPELLVFESLLELERPKILETALN